MNRSKVAVVTSQIIEKIEIIGGTAWAVLMGLVALISMFDDQADGAGMIIFCWVLAFAGGWLAARGRQRKKMRLEFKKYVAILSENPTGSIENIASATGTSVDVTKKNLGYMIKKKFFTNATIDDRENRLILPSMEKKAAEPIPTQEASQKESQLILTVCHCPNCGGINRIAKGMASYLRASSRYLLQARFMRISRQASSITTM